MNKIYIPAIASLLLLLLIHNIASQNHLYVRWYGLDVFMHILGGIGLALAIYWTSTTFFKSQPTTFLSIILMTFLAGTIWELIELHYNIAGAPIGTLRYYVDSVKDLLNDTLGAIFVGYFLYIKKFINK